MTLPPDHNRPDLLAPALASRPGRIDQAVQIPSRTQRAGTGLFELYSRGLTIAADRAPFVELMVGVSGALIRSEARALRR